MNKIVFLVLLIFLKKISLNAAIGCMDNSYHMTRPCDFKRLHYVRCDCPCKRIVNQKGTCIRCGHIGNPYRGEMNSLQNMEIILR